MAIKKWNPRKEPTKNEQRILRRLTRVRKLFAFLRLHRHEIVDDAFQDELAQMYRDTGAGEDPRPPAMMCIALLLQGYVQASDAEAVELSLMITQPLEWCEFSVRYFEGIYRALVEDFFGDDKKQWRNRPFRAQDLSPYISSAGAHPISTASHLFGMLCMLADEGHLTMSEHKHTRQLTFELVNMPPTDLVANKLAEDAGRLTIYRGSE